MSQTTDKAKMMTIAIEPKTEARTTFEVPVRALETIWVGWTGIAGMDLIKLLDGTKSAKSSSAQ